MKHYDCGEFGDHKNQVSIKSPDWWKSSRDFFSVDPCIASEIVFLIVNNVRTLNSCCGHGKIKPSVCVDSNSICIMDYLGYTKSDDYENRPEIFELKG